MKYSRRQGDKIFMVHRFLSDRKPAERLVWFVLRPYAEPVNCGLCVKYVIAI